MFYYANCYSNILENILLQLSENKVFTHPCFAPWFNFPYYQPHALVAILLYEVATNLFLWLLELKYRGFGSWGCLDALTFLSTEDKTVLYLTLCLSLLPATLHVYMKDPLHYRTIEYITPYSCHLVQLQIFRYEHTSPASPLNSQHKSLSLNDNDIPMPLLISAKHKAVSISIPYPKSPQLPSGCLP